MGWTSKLPDIKRSAFWMRQMTFHRFVVGIFEIWITQHIYTLHSGVWVNRNVAKIKLSHFILELVVFLSKSIKLLDHFVTYKKKFVVPKYLGVDRKLKISERQIQCNVFIRFPGAIEVSVNIFEEYKHLLLKCEKWNSKCRLKRVKRCNLGNSHSEPEQWFVYEPKKYDKIRYPCQCSMFCRSHSEIQSEMAFLHLFLWLSSKNYEFPVPCNSQKLQVHTFNNWCKLESYHSEKDVKVRYTVDDITSWCSFQHVY